MRSMHFKNKAGKEYEGYFFASSKTAVVLEVRLETTDGKKVLASHQFKQPASPNGTSVHVYVCTCVRVYVCTCLLVYVRVRVRVFVRAR